MIESDRTNKSRDINKGQPGLGLSMNRHCFGCQRPVANTQGWFKWRGFWYCAVHEDVKAKRKAA